MSKETPPYEDSIRQNICSSQEDSNKYSGLMGENTPPRQKGPGKEDNSLPSGAFFEDFTLFYFLFQIFEKWIIEECAQAKVHTVTNFLNGYDSRILTFGIEHAVNGRRRHAG